MSEDKIIARIARELAEGDAVEGLTQALPATDLQSLMLHVYRERGARRTPAELLEQYERRAMVQSKSLDVRLLLDVERAAFEQAAAFEAVDLSPVAPLGINAVLGQAKVDIAVSDTARDEGRLERARTEVLEPLAREYPDTTLRIDLTREQGRNYYSGLCLSIDAFNREGMRLNLADGGFTTWTQRLLSNAKERLLVSGMGIELLVKLFRQGPG